MLRRILLLAGLLTLVGWPIAAADPPAAAIEEEAAADPIDPLTVKLQLMDGTLVVGKLSIDSLPVETAYGQLNIPIESIHSFTPGLASHPALAKQSQLLITQLGSGDFQVREKAQKELSRLGMSVQSALEQNQHDADPERRSRVQALLDALYDAAESDTETDDERQKGGSPPPRDLVETSEFTVAGRVTISEFDVATAYGPLKAKLADIRHAERLASRRPAVRRTVAVDADSIVQRGWKATEIRVNHGDRITITAGGNLNMTPWGQGVVSTPDGGQNFGWYSINNIPGGMLIASIGNNDRVIRVGSRSSFVAPRSGQLRLAIAMPAEQASQAFPGKYVAKVVVEPR